MPTYAQLGRFEEAIDFLLSAQQPRHPSQPALAQSQLEAAVQVLRAAANKSAAPARLPDFDHELWWVYAYTSTPERMLEHWERDARSGAPIGLRYGWWPMPSSVRKTERFKRVMRDAGFVDIWRMRGWPDLCRPVGADDFECQ